jgi:hypothetical protein
MDRRRCERRSTAACAVWRVARAARLAPLGRRAARAAHAPFRRRSCGGSAAVRPIRAARPRHARPARAYVGGPRGRGAARGSAAAAAAPQWVHRPLPAPPLALAARSILSHLLLTRSPSLRSRPHSEGEVHARASACWAREPTQPDRNLESATGSSLGFNFRGIWNRSASLRRHHAALMALVRPPPFSPPLWPAWRSACRFVP